MPQNRFGNEPRNQMNSASASSKKLTPFAFRTAGRASLKKRELSLRPLASLFSPCCT